MEERPPVVACDEGPVEEIVGKLRAKSAKTRRAAVDAAARLPGAPITRALAERIGDARRSIGLAAIAALGHRRSARARRALIAALDTPDVSLARAAVKALSPARHADVAAAFARLLADEGSPLHMDILEHSGPRPSGELFPPLRALALSRAYPFRRACLAVIARIPHRDVPEVYLSLLDEPDEGLALWAIEALGRHASPQTYARVLRLVRGEGTPWASVRERALELALEWGGGSAILALADLIARGPETAQVLLTRAATLKVAGLVDQAVGVAAAGHPDSVRAAARYVVAIGDDAACRRLWDVARAAGDAATLGLLDGIASGGRIDLLLDVATGATGPVRTRALEAVAAREAAVDAASLAPFLTDPAGAVRALAVHIASRSSAPAARDAIHSALTDAAGPVRRAALSALTHDEAAAIPDRILGLVADHDATVASQARALLETLGIQAATATTSEAFYHVEAGELAKARESFLLCLARTPTDVRLRYELAKISVRMGELEDARLHLDQVLAVAPSHQGALRLAAQLATRSGALDTAEELYMRLLAHAPDDARAVRALGLVLAQQGKHAAAVGILGKAIQGEPTHLAVGLALSRCLRALDHDKEARDTLARLLVHHPTDREALVERADLELTLGNPAIAADLLWQARARGDEDLSIARRLLPCLERAGRLTEAYAVVSELSAAFAGELEIRVAHGRLALATGKAQEALGVLAGVLDAAAEHMEALDLHARAAEVSGDLPAALDSTFKLHSLRGEGSDLLARIARLYERGGQRQAALGCYREHILAHPEDHETRLVLAQADREASDLAGARGKLETCLAAMSGDARVHRELARVLLGLGEIERAGEHAERAVTIEPADPASHALAGAVARAAGDGAGAVARLEESLRLKLEQPDVHRALVSLYHAQRDYPRVVAHEIRSGEPRDADLFHVEVGDAYLHLGHSGRARDHYEKALSTNARSTGALAGLVEIALADRAPERVTSYARRLADIVPGHPAAHAALGLALRGTVDVSDIRGHLEIAIKARADDPVLREALAVAAFETGDSARVIELYPGPDPIPSANPGISALKAQALLRLHRSEQAREAALRLADCQPSSPLAHKLLGLARHAAGDRAGALTALDRALELAGSDATIHRERATVRAASGDQDGAREDLRSALKLTPDDATLLIHLGRLEVDARRGREALAALERAVHADPRDAQAHLLRGRAYALMGRGDEALESFENALALDENLQDAHLEAAGILEEKDEPARARERYEGALASRPGDERALSGLARIARREGRLNDARMHLEELLSTRTDPTAVAIELVDVLAAQGETQACIAQLDALGPSAGHVAVEVGRRLLSRADATGARTLIRFAIGRTPLESDLHVLLSEAEVLAKRPEAARAALRRALEISPDDTEANLKLGTLSREAGDTGEAESSYRRVLVKTPDHPQALIGMAWVRQAQKSPREAAELLVRALAQPGFRLDEQGDLWAGQVLEEAGRHTEAIEAYHRVMAIDGDALAYHRAGALYLAAGQPAEARMIFEALLARFPRDHSAMEALGRICLNTSDFACAARLFEALAAASGRTAPVLSSLVVSYMALGRWVEASDTARQLVEDQPGSVTAHLWAGQIAITQKQFPLACRYLESATQLDPTSGEAWRLHAQALADQGRYSDALGKARRAVEQCPIDPKAHLVLGHVYTKLLMPAKAKLALDAAARLKASAGPEILLELARSQRKVGQPAEALELVKQIIREHGPVPEVVLELSELSFDAHDYPAVVQAYREHRTPGTQHHLAILAGRAYARLGMTAKSAECLAALEEGDGKVPESLILDLAQAAAAAGQVAQALHYLEVGLSRDPACLSLILERGRLFLALKSYREAEHALLTASENDPGNVEIHSLLREVYEASRDWARMRSAFKRIVSTHPFSAQAHLALGHAALALGLPGEARDAFSKALHLDAASAPARLGLARALAATGQGLRAIEEYKAVLRLEATHTDALWEISNLLIETGQSEMARFHLRTLVGREPAGSRLAQAAQEKLVASRA